MSQHDVRGHKGNAVSRSLPTSLDAHDHVKPTRHHWLVGEWWLAAVGRIKRSLPIGLHAAHHVKKGDTIRTSIKPGLGWGRWLVGG